MRCLLPAALLGLVIATPWGMSAPLDGSKSFSQRIGAASQSGGQIEPAPFELKEKFKGGRRATILAIGDHKPVVPMAIFVYDSANQLVAKDESHGDFVSAVWYPPRDGEYKIHIKHWGVDEYEGDKLIRPGYNDVWVAIN
jgi:hypothetical protein